MQNLEILIVLLREWKIPFFFYPYYFTCVLSQPYIIIFFYFFFSAHRVAECALRQRIPVAAKERASSRYGQPATFHYTKEDRRDAVLSYRSSHLIRQQ